MRCSISSPPPIDAGVEAEPLGRTGGKRLIFERPERDDVVTLDALRTAHEGFFPALMGRRRGLGVSTAPADRLHTLDAVRGIAVMGILVAQPSSLSACPRRPMSIPIA